MAAEIAGCVIPPSRSSTIWMRSRCVDGSFHRSAVLSRRTSALLHLTIRSSRIRWLQRITPHIPKTTPPASPVINTPIHAVLEPVLDSEVCFGTCREYWRTSESNNHWCQTATGRKLWNAAPLKPTGRHAYLADVPASRGALMQRKERNPADNCTFSVGRTPRRRINLPAATRRRGDSSPGPRTLGRHESRGRGYHRSFWQNHHC